MNTNMITSVDDKFNRTASTSKNVAISNNKIEVVLDRFANLKSTDVERVLRTLSAVMVEADHHRASGDEYFNYSEDKIEAEVRIKMLISTIYKREGDLDKIERDVCFRNSKALATELADHYWAF